ncbi:hypothetical protein B0H17DRAFT_1153266 [Mycena rosella]|uniref:Uncharacterized protein n=1 Tax=Mycena rosella TaxID=1033263 RepID=A0AAD7FD14_MYCRO|nr:hypothetical protein B0H17DRAFT_1153266 [Mycena rosella]
MPRREKENEIPARSQSGRRRRLTSRLQHTRDATSAATEMLRKKKENKAKRLALRQRQNESALTADRPDDTPEIRELRAALSRAQGERNAAEAANTRPQRRQGPPTRSVARPRNMAQVTIGDIRAALDLSGSQNNDQWAALRAKVRRYMDAGLLELDLGWKEQDNRRLAKVYDAIEAAYPDLERFRAQWATAYLVHESFVAQKTYRSCKSKEGTYRARAREARRSNTSRLRPESPFPADGSGPRAPSYSPNASRAPTVNNSRSASPGTGRRSRSRSRSASLRELTAELDA